jgi:hypothetical protein
VADQQRWFKLWCSAPADDALQSRPPALRWAWVAFGAYTKLHGTSGVVSVSPSNGSLAAAMGVAPDALIETIAQLPSVYLGTARVWWPHGGDKALRCEGEYQRGEYPLSHRGRDQAICWCERHGSIVVTWKNWKKYQEDTTQAQRGYASRSKKRREENKKRSTPKPPGDFNLPTTDNPPPEPGPEARAFVADLTDRLAARFTADDAARQAQTTRERGTNPRATGTNPRAKGTNPSTTGTNLRASNPDTNPEHLRFNIPD